MMTPAESKLLDEVKTLRQRLDSLMVKAQTTQVSADQNAAKSEFVEKRTEAVSMEQFSMRTELNRISQQVDDLEAQMDNLSSGDTLARRTLEMIHGGPGVSVEHNPGGISIREKAWHNIFRLYDITATTFKIDCTTGPGGDYDLNWQNTWINVTSGTVSVTSDNTVTGNVYIYLKVTRAGGATTIEMAATIPAWDATYSYFALYYVPFNTYASQIRYGAIIDMRFSIGLAVVGLLTDSDGGVYFSTDYDASGSLELFDFHNGTTCGALTSSDHIIVRRGGTYVAYALDTDVIALLEPNINMNNVTGAESWFGGLIAEVDHFELHDIFNDTCGDDHHPVAAAGGGQVGYLRCDGDSSRNAMVTGAYVGRIKPFDYLMVDTSNNTTLNWDSRILQGGTWYVGTEGTPQSLFVWNELTADSSIFTNASMQASVNVRANGIFMCGEVSGLSITNWFTGGILTGATVVEKQIKVIDAVTEETITVKALVIL